MKQRYNGYRVERYNVIIDVLGGFSKHLEKSARKLLGARARSVLERIQKSVISNTLNIAKWCRLRYAPYTTHNVNSFMKVFSLFRCAYTWDL